MCIYMYTYLYILSVLIYRYTHGRKVGLCCGVQTILTHHQRARVHVNFNRRRANFSLQSISQARRQLKVIDAPAIPDNYSR